MPKIGGRSDAQVTHKRTPTDTSHGHLRWDASGRNAENRNLAGVPHHLPKVTIERVPIKATRLGRLDLLSGIHFQALRVARLFEVRAPLTSAEEDST